MIIIIRHEKLSDGSQAPILSVIDTNNHLTLHSIDDDKCTELADTLYNLTVDITEIIDYRWMDEHKLKSIKI